MTLALRKRSKMRLIGVNAEGRRHFYDAAWNLNRRTSNGTVSTFAVDNKNQLTSIPVNVRCFYDGNGNLTNVTDLPKDYLYDDENRLTAVWVPPDQSTTNPPPPGPTSTGGWRSEFTYDGLSRLRLRKEYYSYDSGWFLTNTVQYIYDGNRVIQERDGNGSPTVSYTRGNDLSGSLEGAGGIGGLLARSDGYSSGTWTSHDFYFADGNGNVTYMLDSSQSMAASYRYDPFGNTISSSGTLAGTNVYRFSSKEIHVNSGMYYYLYRFYDPGLQRWINRDPVGEIGFEALKFQRSNFSRRIAVFERLEGVNLYEFVRNEPTLRYDSLGLASLACLSAIEQAAAANAALAAAMSAGDWGAIPGLAQAAIAAASKMAAACSEPPPPPPPGPVDVPVLPPITPPPKSWYNRCWDFHYKPI